MSLVFDLEPPFFDLYESCRTETMTSIERMYALYGAVCHLVARDIPGDIVECGVWRGGSMMLVARTLLHLGRTDRTLWLYDTFDGMTRPTGEDVQAMSGRTAGEILAAEMRDAENPFWGVATRETVAANLARTGYPAERLRFVQGDVLDTVPACMPDQVALLRLDTDWYASTRHELEHFYPRVPRGGIVIVDDYGYWRGARKAVDEYWAALGAPPFLQRVDFTGRLAVKD